MIKDSSFKIFLSNGITLTVKVNENIIINNIGGNTFKDLYNYVKLKIQNNECVEFGVEIEHEYKDEKGKVKKQNINHKYFIPSEKITWYMIEEV